MSPSEFLSWSDAVVLVGVIIYFMVFGKPDNKYRYAKMFGTKSLILGNKSAVIPKRVLFYAFGSSACCLLTAFILYSYGF